MVYNTAGTIVISNNIKTSNEIESESISDGGLMDSSWPMFQHDVRHTGRSPYGEFKITLPRDKTTSSSPFFRFLECYPLLNLLLQKFIFL